MSKAGMDATVREEVGVNDIMQRWGCGRAKARKIMDEIGAIHIGRTPFVRRSDIDSYLQEHGAIRVDWGNATKEEE